MQHAPPSRLASTVRDFIRLESAGGLILIIAAVAAMAAANTPLRSVYGMLLDVTLAVQIGELAINKPLLLWVSASLPASLHLSGSPSCCGWRCCPRV